MIIKVVSGREIPPETGKVVYPFRKMKVGDSFKLDEEYSVESRNKLMSASSNYGRRKDMRFVVRTETTPNGKEIWCYREK